MIAKIKEEYLRNDVPWYVGFSGGKDSSAVLKLLFSALLEIDLPRKPVEVIYCDTGVEIPTIAHYVKRTLKSLKSEARSLQLPIKFTVAKPRLEDRYFVKVIGRGYPPPTNVFRWCTDRLRINPVKEIINQESCSMVLLGVRLGESNERDRTIKKHKTEDPYFLNQASSTKTAIFSPIINYSVKDVWATIKHTSRPHGIDHSIIGQLYKDAGSECPVFREAKGTPCGKGRFGCWTCTVVRRDKSVESMISNGYPELQPLFAFRNWLAEFRENGNYRCSVRRNGNLGLGPITLEGRKIILKRLLKAERQSGIDLIENEEVARIKELWAIDRRDPAYHE